MSDKKVYSGLLEFTDDLKVMVAVDEDADVKKAVTIDEDDAETSFLGSTPTGKKEITSTAEVNVASYATAQVVDADLVASNIKKDVDILGVVGSYEGGGGSSDFSTAEIVITNSSSSDQQLSGFVVIESDDSMGYSCSVTTNSTKTVIAVLYKNEPTDGKIDNYSNDIAVAYTGDVTDDGDGYFIIGGAGAITISDANPVL